MIKTRRIKKKIKKKKRNKYNCINRNNDYPNTFNYDSLMGRISDPNNSAMKERKRIYPQSNYRYNNENTDFNTPYNNRSIENSYNPNEDNRVSKAIRQYYYKIENNTIGKSSLKKNDKRF